MAVRLSSFVGRLRDISRTPCKANVQCQNGQVSAAKSEPGPLLPAWLALLSPLAPTPKPCESIGEKLVTFLLINYFMTETESKINATTSIRCFRRYFFTMPSTSDRACSEAWLSFQCRSQRFKLFKSRSKEVTSSTLGFHSMPRKSLWKNMPPSADESPAAKCTCAWHKQKGKFRSAFPVATLCSIKGCLIKWFSMGLLATMFEKTSLKVRISEMTSAQQRITLYSLQKIVL